MEKEVPTCRDGPSRVPHLLWPSKEKRLGIIINNGLRRQSWRHADSVPTAATRLRLRASESEGRERGGCFSAGARLQERRALSDARLQGGVSGFPQGGPWKMHGN